MLNSNIQNHPKLKAYNDEIEKCLNNELYSQVTSTCRQALEYMANQYIIEFNQSLNLCKNLNEKINGLKSSGIVSEDWVKNSTTIRRIANDGGAHDNTSSSGHVINKNEANKVYETLIVLENVFLNKMPYVSVKEIQEGFKNKKFERDDFLDRLENNNYIFNASCHDSKDGNTWYFFNFKVKVLAHFYSFIRPERATIKQIGEDNGYYIYEFNDIKANAEPWASRYLDKLNKFNAMSDDEIIEYNNNLIKQETEKKEKEAKTFLDILNKNDYIYETSFYTDKNNNIVYTFKFKIKKIVQDTVLSLYAINGMHKIGEENEYYIYSFEADRNAANSFLISYNDKITKYNSMSDKEINELITKIEEIKKKNEEEERAKIEEREKKNRERLETINRNKKKTKAMKYIALAIVLLLFGYFGINLLKQKADEKELQEQQQIQLLEEQKENELKLEKANELRDELIKETTQFDINYIDGSSINMPSGGCYPTILNSDECGGNGSYLEWVENGEKKSGKVRFYYKPTSILYDDEAVDFIKRIETIFINEYIDDGLYDNGELNTNDYYYCVVKFSIDDSNLTKYLGEGYEYNAIKMATCDLEERDNKNWKTTDSVYYGKAFFYRLLDKHILGDGVYPIYAVMKFEKGYTNYNFVYDMIDDGNGWVPNYYKIEIYKHYN